MRFVLSFFVFLFPALLLAQDWELVKSDWGIDVHMKAKEGSKVKQAKAACLIKTAPQKVIDVLYDFENYHLWFDECHKSKLLEKVGENSYIIYLALKLPFPFQNRDIVTRLDFQTQADGGLVINTQNLPNHIPSRKGHFRVQSFDTRLVVEPKSAETTLLTTFLHSEMGKRVPLWAVNDAMLWGPYLSIEKIRRLAEGYYDPNQGF